MIKIKRGKMFPLGYHWIETSILNDRYKEYEMQCAYMKCNGERNGIAWKYNSLVHKRAIDIFLYLFSCRYVPFKMKDGLYKLNC